MTGIKTYIILRKFLFIEEAVMTSKLVTPQRTIKHKLSCSGTGLHTGHTIYMTMHPAAPDTGIVFRRTDIQGVDGVIPALYNNVTETQLGTVISNQSGAKVSTIEHLMSAIWALGIDNMYIEINGPEVPIMDGSAEPFLFLFDCAGIEEQNKARKLIEILKPVTVEAGDKKVTISPDKDFSVNFGIEFEHKAIGQQEFNFANKETFRKDIGAARTFGFEHEVEALRKIGLARGGSLENAVVVGKEGVINKEGLRYKDEFVRHKVLDCLGDVYLAGGHLVGRIDAFKSGHDLNNKLLREVFAQQDAYRMV